MKNLLKRNSQKVNVNLKGCSEIQPEKEVEIYKSIAEGAEKLKDSIKSKEGEEHSTSSIDNVVALKEETPLGGNNMVQEENNVNDGADEQMLGADDNEKLAGKRDEVKFIKGDQQNGDAKIDIGAVNGKAFTGMTKEELMKYANDPFWIRLRWIFFISFWLVWLGMLIGAILIIIDAPKCAAPEPLPWYKSGILAKFPSFEVSKDNVAAANQMKAGGVIYELPAELTYNIREPEVEEKIKNIINHYKDTNTRVILDITPNYVPKTSRLMKQALDDETKRSAFVWMEKVQVPNNWLSLVNGSAWAQVTPGNYVLSQFGDGLYDLHMNDTIVKKELGDVLQHAIDLGIGGIRLKNTKFFILSKSIKDEIPADNNKCDLTQYCFWTHSQTTFPEGLGDVLYEYRDVVKNSSAEAFLSVADDIMRPQIYKTSTGEFGVDMPMYGEFVKNLAAPKEKKLRSNLKDVLQETDNWTQWNVVDLGADTAASPFTIYLFLSLLPGTPVLPVGTEVYGNITNKVFEQFEQLRLSPSYMHGDFDMLEVDPLLGYTRIKSGNPGYLVVYNPTEVNQSLNFNANSSFPETMNVKFDSNTLNGTKTGQILVSDLEISPLSTIVLSYVPVKSD